LGFVLGASPNDAENVTVGDADRIDRLYPVQRSHFQLLKFIWL
jgi:hypothetical protein